jgi:3-mercaptopyruvate sulfurtransferase SseA
MRLFISKAAALGLCACALLACSPQDGSAPAAKSAPATNGSATAQAAKPGAHESGETRRISVEETQQAITAGTAVVVDVRNEGDYKASHIKSAISIPLQQFDKRTGELPKDKLIITYCA